MPLHLHDAIEALSTFSQLYEIGATRLHGGEVAAFSVETCTFLTVAGLAKILCCHVKTT
jgi:hypothetical protein